MTNKKKIILTILFCLFIAIACFFGFTIANKQDLNVKADTVDSSYSYSSANLPFYLTGYSAYPDKNTGLFSDFYTFSWTGDANVINCYWYPRPNYKSTSVIELTFTNFVYDTWTPVSKQFNYATALQSDRFASFYIHYYIDSGFNFNILYFTLESARWGGVNQYVAQHLLNYYDNNGKHISLFLFANFDANSSYSACYKYNLRTYYLSNSFSSNEFYQAGKQQGLLENQPNIYDEAYQKAIDDNKSDWEQIGYRRGVQSANDYTFLGLIGATIDAPISALFGYIDHDSSSPTYNQRIGGFFNFELLGVNLKDFFFAVLSFAVVIVIVRFAIGK